MKYSLDVFLVQVPVSLSCISNNRSSVTSEIGYPILNNYCGDVWISSFLSQKFAHPTTGFSPANFTEGEGSQAKCSAKVIGVGVPSASVATVTEPLEGNVKDIAGKRGIQRQTKEHEKQLREEEI
jgi:hypothetical protein